MIEKPKPDEASFEHLVSFDTTPPPPNVHNAPTTVAALPDCFLDEMKVTRKFRLAPPVAPSIGWRVLLVSLVAVAISLAAWLLLVDPR